MIKTAETFEESLHYGGRVVVRFYPLAHFYKVWDPDYIDPETNEASPLEGKRIGGATSLTGTMNKGQGLMLSPMYEAKKYLKQYFQSTTVQEFVDNPLTIEDLLKEACNAHNKKSDRGKSVGTDAHAWVQLYLERLADFQAGNDKEFVAPEIPPVEEIVAVLKRSYIRIVSELKPKTFEEYGELPRLIFRDLEIQKAMWTEAEMIRKATSAAKAWFERHEIEVHGVEGTVYSRSLLISGQYDADLSVTCTKKCGWCYRNGNETLPEKDFTGRYVVDYKSTNASTSAPKGIYSEYLAQCGVYDIGLTEEFPDRKYDGHLILNGSKNEEKTDKAGNKFPVFASHFSFSREANCDWARTCAAMKEHMYRGEKEIEASK